MRTWRERSPLLGLLYLLTTLVVEGGHGHAHESADRVQVGCNDPRAGLAGHSAPDTGHARDDCPVCQVRAQVPFWQLAAATTPECPVAAGLPAVKPAPGLRTPSPTRSRAPPSR